MTHPDCSVSLLSKMCVQSRRCLPLTREEVKTLLSKHDQYVVRKIKRVQVLFGKVLLDSATQGVVSLVVSLLIA